MERETYINTAVAKIKGKYIRHQVAQELADHIDDRISYYEDAGFVSEIATQKALEHMGNAEDVGETISKLHNMTSYEKVAYIFNYLYLAGGLFGAFCTIMLFSFKWDLYEWPGAFVCFASCIVFILYALGFYYSHKSQNESVIMQNGIISIGQIVLSCFTMLPCGYSVLSLLFEFPYTYTNGIVDYFYWPFDENICLFVSDDFYNSYSAAFESVSIALYVLMCLFAVLPIITGIISIITAGFIKNDEFDRYDNAVQKKIKKLATLLLALGIFGLGSISFQYVMTQTKIEHQNIQYEQEHGQIYMEMFEKYEQIKLPATPQEIEKQYGYLTEDYEEYGCYYNEIHADIYFDNIAVQNDGKFDGYFDKKGISNNTPYEITDKEFKKIKSIPIGTSLEDFYENYFTILYVANVSETWIDDKNTITELTLQTKHMGSYAYLTFENDKLSDINMEDYDDFHDIDLGE